MLFPDRKLGTSPAEMTGGKSLTPELRLPGRRSVKFPSFSFRVPSEDDGIVADFLRDEVHPRVLESLREHGVTSNRDLA